MRFFVGLMLFSSVVFGVDINIGYSYNSYVYKNSFSHELVYRAASSGVVNFKIDNLSSDVDLYVKKGSRVSKSSWDCRPYKGGRSSEICSMSVLRGDVISAIVHGYTSGSYHFSLYGNNSLNIESISVNGAKSSYVEHDRWRYYKLNNLTQYPLSLKVLMSNLSADVDLYVKKGTLPTSRSYDCRPYHGGTKDEECTITASSSDDVYIGVHGYSYNGGNYRLSVKPQLLKRATILLHGLASSSKTWNTLISSKFRGKCTRIYKGRMTTDDGRTISSPQPFGASEYCFKVDFGAYDRESGLKDLLRRKCTQGNGCRGDYSTFKTLGREVESAVRSVIDKLGSETAITLVGHSRGGLAASAYIGSRGYGMENVKALLTTGTPFLGSPLGKIHSYMKTSCLPYSIKKNDRFCKIDWEARKFILDNGGLDITVPSVGFLQNGSSAFNEIFSIDRIKAIQIGKRDYKSLIYKGVQLGNLQKIGDFVYNAFPNVNGALDYAPTVKEFSDEGEEYILGSNPQSKAISLNGDGIVPKYNQDIAKIYAEGKEWYLFGYRRVYVGFSDENRISKEYDKNILHTQEPTMVDDLSEALNILWLRQSNLMTKTLQPATVSRWF